MTNKRRTNLQPADTIADSDLPANTQPARQTLADIRTEATARVADAAHSVAHTIADLEAWRAEIDATIAFLKAQRGR
jgi:hypothetical protein